MNEKEITSPSLRTIISVACDVTLILGYPPEIDDDDNNHLTWISPNDELPEVLICNTGGMVSASPELLREEFLGLLGVAVFHNYEFKALIFDDDDDENIGNFNPFSVNSKH